MFHFEKGLFFERKDNEGTVRIVKTKDGKEPGPDNIIMDQDIPEESWGSIVCSVSAKGDHYDRWLQAREFHGFPYKK